MNFKVQVKVASKPYQSDVWQRIMQKKYDASKQHFHNNHTYKFYYIVTCLQVILTPIAACPGIRDK
jgi:hypothetical protein